MKYRYLIFSELIQKRRGFSEYMKKNDELKLGSLSDIFADQIFTFVDGKTKYYKDRLGEAYQYTDEEQLVIALKSVLL